ncbi:MAG TPA: glutamyl-tRNA reductase [Candidatus Macondimonas sp.]|nr:glutamyl-tRNA reductase [Candidatus Macondimonas sp.]
MPLFSVGLNHTTAAVPVRERIAYAAGDVARALADARRETAVEEMVLLSTCNRTELYFRAKDDEPVIDWLSRDRHMPRAELDTCLYRLTGDAVVRHLLRVAAGLDSMVVGEAQILGQLKQAYGLALENGHIGHGLNRLFACSFATAKRVRTDTLIGAQPVSVASIATDLARRIFSNFREHTALMVGAGQMIGLCTRHLHTQGVGRIIIANRDVGRAVSLAQSVQGFGIGLTDLEAHLAEADILIACTGSPDPLVHLPAVRQALRRRKHRPMLMIDLGMPRDIDPAIEQLDDVFLYTLDDLTAESRHNREIRSEQALLAETIVEEETARFTQWLSRRDHCRSLKQLRERSEQTRRAALVQAQERLARGEEPVAVLEDFSRALTNRLLHAPTQRLREAIHESRQDLIDDARRLFDLDEPTP